MASRQLRIAEHSCSERLKGLLDDYPTLLDYEAGVVLHVDDTKARVYFAAEGEQAIGNERDADLALDAALDDAQGRHRERREFAQRHARARLGPAVAPREIEIIERYLPAAMDADALNAIVAEEVAKAASNGQAGPKAMGAVIKAVKERVGASADGAAIAAAVKSALA